MSGSAPPRGFRDPSHRILVRNAMPTAQDLHTADGRRLAREARNELLRLYREAKKAGKLCDLDPLVHSAIASIKMANGSKLPAASLGRHKVDKSRDLALATAVVLAGGTVRDMHAIAGAAGASFETVRAAYYRLRNTTALRAEISRRHIGVEQVMVDWSEALLLGADPAVPLAKAGWYLDWRSALAGVLRPETKTRAPRVAD